MVPATPRPSSWRASREGAALEYVPMAGGDGYAYRLVRVREGHLRGDQGSWEALVDAATGELIAFEDTNQYAGRNVIGGVYPVSNDQRPPDGIEQPGWPMPFVNVATAGRGAHDQHARAGSGCAAGTLTTALVGLVHADHRRLRRHQRVLDGRQPRPRLRARRRTDTNCASPPATPRATPRPRARRITRWRASTSRPAGTCPRTPGSRPSLLANVNLPNSCGAFWNGSSINLYRENAQCGNLRELPGVSVHEWGHGLDNNGIVPTISQPGDAIADIHAFLQLDTSCIGRGFFRNQVCGGYGDPCLPPVATGCTGVRDIDFAKHTCGRPHTITWVQSGFPAGVCADGLPRPACPTGGNALRPGDPLRGHGRGRGGVRPRAARPARGRVRRQHLAGADHPALLPRRAVRHRLVHLRRRRQLRGHQRLPAPARRGRRRRQHRQRHAAHGAPSAPRSSATRSTARRRRRVNSGCGGGPPRRPRSPGSPRGRGSALTWTAVPGAARYGSIGRKASTATPSAR